MSRGSRHWATDPRYAEKLLRVYREHGFDEMDKAPAAEDREMRQI